MVTRNIINNTVANNDFTVSRSTAGTAIKLTTNHTDNTDDESNAFFDAVVGGANGGDAFLYLNITGAQDYSFGIDNTDSDSLKIQDDANPSTGNTLWKMTSGGSRTMPLQPAFSAYVNANVANATGNATQYTTCSHNNTTLYDQNGDYDDLGVFTAPLTGIYKFAHKVTTGDLAAGHTDGSCIMRFSNRYVCGNRCNANSTKGATTGTCSWITSTIVDMDAADTGYPVIAVAGSTGTVDIIGAADTIYSGFDGYLVS